MPFEVIIWDNMQRTICQRQSQIVAPNEYILEEAFSNKIFSINGAGDLNFRGSPW